VKPPEPLTDAEVDAALVGSSWERVEDVITLERSFGSFAEALGFVVSVGAIAEAQDHHPEISLSWVTVHLEVSTHQISGLSVRDIELARRIDQLR